VNVLEGKNCREIPFADLQPVVGDLTCPGYHRPAAPRSASRHPGTGRPVPRWPPWAARMRSPTSRSR